MVLYLVIIDKLELRRPERERIFGQLPGVGPGANSEPIRENGHGAKRE